MSRTRRAWIGAFTAAVAVGLIAVATASGSGAGRTEVTAARGLTLAQAAASGAVTNYVTYVHGKAGPANNKLAPVQIGWINQQGGAVVIGGLATAGAQLAVNYVNKYAGGIDGHPVELKTCFIASTEQEGTTCGQELRANKAVSVIEEGAVATGIQPFYSTVGGAKPVIVGVAATPVDSVQKNAVILFGDVTHVLEPFGTYAKDVLHAKNVAILYPTATGGPQAAAAFESGLKAAGIPFKAVGYDQSDTDLIGPLTSAGASSAGMVIPYSFAQGCVALAKGLTSLGINDPKKIVSAPLCLNSQVASGLGGDYPHWTYAIASSLFGDPTDPGMPIYEKVTKQFGVTANAPDPWNIVAFGETLSTIRFLNQVGYGHITPSAVQSAAKAFTGPVALGAPALACGKYKSAPAVCNDRAQFFEYLGKGDFKKAAGWLQPPS